MSRTDEMTGSPAQLSVILVTYNSEAFIAPCIDAVLDQAATLPLELIVVDNGSTDSTVSSVAERYPSVRLISGGGNRGFAGGNNEGARHASADILLLLNPDTVALPGSLAKLTEAIEADPGVGVAGGLLIGADGGPVMSYGDFPTLAWALTATAPMRRLRVRPSADPGRVPIIGEPSRDVDYVSGACLMIRRCLWDALGGMDEDYFLYFEETDLCLRARTAGWRCRFVSEASVRHLEGASFADRSVARSVRFHEGLLLFMRKNRGPAASLLVRVWMLLVNASLLVVGSLFGRWMPGVRANREVQHSLLCVALNPATPAAVRQR